MFFVHFTINNSNLINQLQITIHFANATQISQCHFFYEMLPKVTVKVLY